MNKIKLIFVCILILSISLLGCIEKKSIDASSKNQKIINSSPETFLLSLEAFEKGYQMRIRESELKSLVVFNFNSINYICADYYFTDPGNDTGYPWIGLEIYNLNSAMNASTFIIELNDYKKDFYNNTNSVYPLNELSYGNESYFGFFKNVNGIFYKTFNATICYVFFRIYNVVVYIFIEGISTENENYLNMIQNYSSSIENKIEQSLIN